MFKGFPFSKSVYYRRKRKADKLGCDILSVPDERGKHGNQARGNNNGRWNNGKLISSHGYIIVRVDKSHPLAFGNGYCYEHDLIMYNHTGIKPTRTLNVHHINGDKQDNRINNLEFVVKKHHMYNHTKRRKTVADYMYDILKENNLTKVSYTDRNLLDECSRRCIHTNLINIKMPERYSRIMIYLKSSSLFEHKHISFGNNKGWKCMEFVIRSDINGRVEHDIRKFPEDLQIQEYPK